MSDKFEDVVTNWRLMIPIILTVAGLIIAIKFGVEYTLLTWDHITTEDAQVKASKIQVSPAVSGRVLALYVDEGAAVKRGDLLAELDPISYQSDVEQARAMREGVIHQLEAAQQDLALTGEKHRGELAQAQALLARRRSEMQEAEAAIAFERERVRHFIAEQHAALEVARAREVESRVQLGKALTEWQRAQELLAAGVIAQERLDAAQVAHAQASARKEQAGHQVRQAEATLDTAKASEKLVQMKHRRLEAQGAEVRKEEAAVQFAWANLAAVHLKEEEVNRLHAQKRGLEARLSAAELQLARTRILSPIDGVVLLRKAEAGEWLERGQPLLLLVDQQDIWVQTNIREGEIAEVRVGNKVRIWVDAYPEKRFDGEVVSVGAAALSELAEAKPSEFFSKIEQRIPVKITLHEHDGLLKAGMMVWVGIERRARSKE
ncbi:MAG: HlyD family secretion protein [Nitrospinae bacterium]|nr:HlyD family secretion protein [Nitrospinota bacterium]